MARPSVELPAWLAGEIRLQAQLAAPRECCGLVEGLRQGGHFQVMALHPARNLALEPERFEIDPRDHLAASKTARARGHQLIGCYHSHPEGAARPSPRDAEGAAEDNFLWLIAAAGELAAFIYLGGEFLGADWTKSPA